MNRRGTPFKGFIDTTYRYFIIHIQIQFFITLLSLPLLMCWGMPLSLASIAGNIIFAPIMALFLGICSLLFITEIFSVPNRAIVFFLEKITTFLVALLGFGNKRWLIGFAKPPTLIMLLIPLFTIACLMHPLCRTPLRRISLFSLIFCAIIVYGYYSAKPDGKESFFMPNTNEKIQVILHENRTYTLHDSGYFNTKVSPDKYINFELKPYFIQKGGIPFFKKIVLDKTGIRSLQALLTLCTFCTIEDVFVRKPKSKISKKFWTLFYRLKSSINGTLKMT